MKTPIPAFLTVVLVALAPSAFAAGTLSFYGYQVDTPEWRSTNVTKTITLAPAYTSTTTDPDGYYGTDGYLLPSYTAGLPSYAPLSGITAPGTVPYASGTYAQDVDDPTEPVGANVANLPAGYWAIAYQAPGASTEVNLYNFTLSGTIPPAFLIGIAFGNLNTPTEDYFGTAFFRAGLNGGAGTAQIPAIGNNKLIDWIFFKVDNAVAGDTINIYGTSGPVANGGVNLAAVSFDTIPEPASPLMLGLGAAALACSYRRRR
jgi:hypothetical protein